jgi:small subunit ribosomal protein S3
VIRDWKSHWYAEGEDYADLLLEDAKIRQFIQDTAGRAGISRVEIERFPQQASVTIWTARPGIVIGRSCGQSAAQRVEGDDGQTYLY